MKTLSLLLVLITGTLYSQDFRPYHVVADSLLVKTVVSKKTSYSYQTYLFDIMGRQLKVKMNKKLMFNEEGFEDTKKIVPFVFQSENSADNLLLYTELSSESLQGFNLYILNGLGSKKISFFPFALKVTNSNNSDKKTFQSLANVIHIETNGSQWRITFNEGEIVVHQGTDREETRNATEIKFLYNGKKLKEVDEF
jgi:hypothetical protein